MSSPITLQQRSTVRTHFLYVALALFFDILFTVPDALHAEDAAQKEGQIEPAAVRLGRPVDFEKDIQPILDEKCVACHNVAIAESKLILEDVPAILKGGKRGPGDGEACQVRLCQRLKSHQRHAFAPEPGRSCCDSCRRGARRWMASPLAWRRIRCSSTSPSGSPAGTQTSCLGRL